MRTFVFVTIVGAERRFDFCLSWIFRIGAASDFHIFVTFGAKRTSDFYIFVNDLCERVCRVRSRETCRMKADLDLIGFSDVPERLLSDRTD